MQYRLLIVLASMIFHYCSGMELSPTQHIIFLNGTTTAGKSSIASELKKLLEAQSLPVEVLAIDTFTIPKLQWRLVINRINPFNIFVPNCDLISSLEIQQMRAESREELCKAARASYEQGNIVIIDAPVYSSDQNLFYEQALDGLKIIWSLVYCPISTLVERVISRNEISGITGQRSILQTLDQFSQLYTSKTNYFIDTLSQETLYAICDRARKQHAIMQDKIPDFLKSVQNAICPFDCDIIQNSMLENFGFHGSNETSIGPVVQHDCIVNTGLNSSALCAQKIIDTFQTKQIGY